MAALLVVLCTTGAMARRLTSVEQVAKLSASDGSAYDYLGGSVAMFDDRIVAGAFGDDSDQGAAYVFNATTYAQVAKLVASDGSQSDEFGNSVAIYADTIVVGANEDSDLGTNAGAAYVFSGETQVAKLKASDGSEYDYFGWSVAIFENTIVVGSILDDEENTNAGAAYVFDASTFEQIWKLTASDGGYDDYFGYAVAIFNDVIVVGAPRDDDVTFNAGAVYVYENGVQVCKLVASDGEREGYLGETVALYNDTIVAGASYTDASSNDQGAVYVFRYNSTTYVQLWKLVASDGSANDWFGVSVAIYDGIIVVGASGDNDEGAEAGSAYVFEYDDDDGDNNNYARLVAKLLASDGFRFDYFGSSVAAYQNTIVAGAYSDNVGSSLNVGSAYVFSIDSPTYAPAVALA
ncbi:hypothetical protein CTAYLR_004875 [Chrysophaeum taylorii]|uniref:Uncharacterized protein n=1 Tax=Chrysophaeum taylorii TaxID=2483200 RepID=A0AAD7XIY3_9STRA|nr:hypothetical protein CTAYLR_004875 [Chrysophaeum taylorii]